MLLVPVVVAAAAEAGFSLRAQWFHRAPELLGLSSCLMGLGIRVFTVGTAPRGTSGRSTRAMKAALLNTIGIYSLVRHPLYLANALIATGLAIYTGHGWLVLIGALAVALYYERIALAEEAFLEERFGDEFRAWAARVPAVWPRLTGYVPPAMPFSWTAALRRECYAIGVIGTAVLGIDGVKHYAQTGRIDADPLSASIFVFSMAVFLPVWVAKKLKHGRK